MVQDKKLAKKIVALNITQDSIWIAYVIGMIYYFNVPYTIALIPVLSNLVLFVFGLHVVRAYNKKKDKDTKLILERLENHNRSKTYIGPAPDDDKEQFRII